MIAFVKRIALLLNWVSIPLLSLNYVFAFYNICCLNSGVHLHWTKMEKSFLGLSNGGVYIWFLKFIKIIITSKLHCQISGAIL